MRSAVLRSLSWIALPVLGLAAGACETRAEPCTSLASLAWIHGTWQAESARRITQETWRPAGEKTLEGYGETRDAADRSLIGFETMRLVEMSGQVFFIAKVKGNPLPVAFAGVDCTATRALFENRAHDFPTRLDYRLVDGGQLDVHVSGNDADGFTVSYRRIVASDAR